MALQDEIDLRSTEIHTDGYPMSIGEIMSIYESKEMDIHPEFQRFFRWSDYQKSRLIESILLGIPIPSVFVSQRNDGVWDVIDGLQRLSTIFEFAGILRGEDGNTKEASTLLGTKYLPSLEGKKWRDDENPDNSLDQLQRLFIKRAKLNIQIIKRQSDDNTKYELFQRLNTGGSPLSDQELRNCLLVMLDNTFFQWLHEMSQNVHFQNCLSMTERAKQEAYDVELCLRFFVYKNSTREEFVALKDIGEYITDKMVNFATNGFNRANEQQIFERTFELLDGLTSDNSFRKFNQDQDRFQGAFSISAFEVISRGLGQNIDQYHGNQANINLIEDKIKDVWSNPIFIQRSGSGSRASSRLPHFSDLSQQIFGFEN
jgi:hypothetical protein